MVVTVIDLHPEHELDAALIDGAVAELHVGEDGTVTAEIRIPPREDGHG